MSSLLHTSAPVARLGQRRSSSRRPGLRSTQPPRALGGDIMEGLKKVKEKIEWELNFENWAPRSSRAWRLRERPTEVSVVPQDGVLAEAEAAGPASPVNPDAALSGVELARLCFAKYGKYHDMAIKHTRIQKNAARWVALNVYVGHLGQRSFPYTEEMYLEKLDSVAFMLSKWNQAKYTREFFAEPPIPRRGLPSRPRVDTAVSLRLNSSPTWDETLTQGFFLEDEEMFPEAAAALAAQALDERNSRN